MRSLVKVFTVRLKTLCVWLPKRSCEDWSDCADGLVDLRWAHMQSCRKCCTPAKIVFKLSVEKTTTLYHLCVSIGLGSSIYWSSPRLCSGATHIYYIYYWYDQRYCSFVRTLYIIIENLRNAALTLNFNLNTISKWLFDWLVAVNPNKTGSLLISKIYTCH